MSAAAAAERPIHIIESGPAAGVVGAAELARRLGDSEPAQLRHGRHDGQGGARSTTGRFLRVNSLEVGGGINIAGRLLSGGGYHVRAPAIDIAEVGAGGGSIARLDAGGALRVGPDSAGAVAGPGLLRPRRRRADRHRRQRGPRLHQSGRARRRRTADPPRPGRARAAGARRGDRSACRSTTPRGACTAWRTRRWRGRCAPCPPSAAAIRATSHMLAFGGNGPVHAATLARLLDIRSICWCRRCPGCSARSACCFPEIEHHYVRTFKQRLDRPRRRRARGGLPRAAKPKAPHALVQEGFAPTRHRFERLVDLRYAGANSELTLPFPAAAIAASLRERLRRRARAAIRLPLRRGGGRDHERARHRARRDGTSQVPDRLSLVGRDRRSGERADGVLRPRVRLRCRRRSAAAATSAREWTARTAPGRGVRQHDRRSAGRPRAAHRVGHDRDRARVMR